MLAQSQVLCFSLMSEQMMLAPQPLRKKWCQTTIFCSKDVQQTDRTFWAPRSPNDAGKTGADAAIDLAILGHLICAAAAVNKREEASICLIIKSKGALCNCVPWGTSYLQNRQLCSTLATEKSLENWVRDIAEIANADGELGGEKVTKYSHLCNRNLRLCVRGKLHPAVLLAMVHPQYVRVATLAVGAYE